MNVSGHTRNKRNLFFKPDRWIRPYRDGQGLSVRKDFTVHEKNVQYGFYSVVAIQRA